MMLDNVLHIPQLSGYLFSIQAHEKVKDCSVSLDDFGSYLLFPTFFVPLSDAGSIDGSFSPDLVALLDPVDCSHSSFETMIFPGDKGLAADIPPLVSPECFVELESSSLASSNTLSHEIDALEHLSLSGFSIPGHELIALEVDYANSVPLRLIVDSRGVERIVAASSFSEQSVASSATNDSSDFVSLYPQDFHIRVLLRNVFLHILQFLLLVQ